MHINIYSHKYILLWYYNFYIVLSRIITKKHIFLECVNFLFFSHLSIPWICLEKDRKRKVIENISKRHFHRLKKKCHEYRKDVDHVTNIPNLLSINETQNLVMNSLQENNVKKLMPFLQDNTKQLRDNDILFLKDSDKVLIFSCVTESNYQYAL